MILYIYWRQLPHLMMFFIEDNHTAYMERKFSRPWNLGSFFLFQLSSKCDNRLFHVRFNIPQAGNYPFLEAFSNPIRCISCNRNARTSLIIWKRPASGILPVKCTLSSKYESPELEHNTVREAKPSPSSKRVRLGKADYSFQQLDDECNSNIRSDFKVRLIIILHCGFHPEIVSRVLLIW